MGEVYFIDLDSSTVLAVILFPDIAYYHMYGFFSVTVTVLELEIQSSSCSQLKNPGVVTSISSTIYFTYLTSLPLHFYLTLYIFKRSALLSSLI